MKILLDEMHSPVAAVALADAGHDVVAVAADTNLRGLADEQILEHAVSAGRAIVTENVSDFGPLASSWVAEERSHAGLIFTSQRRFNRANLAYPSNLSGALEAFLEVPPVAGESWTWWL